jgi:lysophospholipase L1-like esterase
MIMSFCWLKFDYEAFALHSLTQNKVVIPGLKVFNRTFMIMFRLTLLFLAVFTVSAWADNSTADIVARVRALTPPAGQPAATYPVPREDWIIRFVGNLDKLKQGPYDLVFDGDSITDGWQGVGLTVLKERYGNLKVLDAGISGDQVQHVLWRLQHGELEGQSPKLIMLMIGTNNCGQDPKDVAAGIKLVLNEYETRCPDAHILLLGVFPRTPTPTDPARLWVKSLNAIISTYSSDPKVTYLDIGDKFLQPDGTLTADIMPDFLHPSTKGYGIWADAIQPVIDKYFPAPATK